MIRRIRARPDIDEGLEKAFSVFVTVPVNNTGLRFVYLPTIEIGVSRFADRIPEDKLIIRTVPSIDFVDGVAFAFCEVSSREF